MGTVKLEGIGFLTDTTYLLSGCESAVSVTLCKSMPLSYIIDERCLIFIRKLLYHDNVVLGLASLPVVYYEYIRLCSQYAVKDPLC